MGAQLQAEAETRSRRVQQAASEQLELQLHRLREMLLWVPQQWQLTESRVNDERQRGAARKERELSTLQNDRSRFERNRCRADEAEAVAERAAVEVDKVQSERMMREIQNVADEMKVFEALDTLVSSLRSGALWRDSQM